MSAKKNLKITLLDRAKADLSVVRVLLPQIADDAEIDVCAYHCSQCIEKAVKYVADLSGQEYLQRHELSLIAEDLEIPDILPLIKPYIPILDTWISATRYSESLRSNIKLVNEIYEVCKAVVSIADEMTPKKVEAPSLVKKDEG
ncbi:MAG: HEPN domain-containing protein [Clostridiales bacterium]|jgi:HEPN domain-containing protein|nr:HEPN domain-containing protein [Clostridiales bacterium]